MATSLEIHTSVPADIVIVPDAVISPGNPSVMKKIMKKKHIFATAVHALMNIVFYGFLLQYIGLAIMQADPSQLVWLVFFTGFLLTDSVFHIWQLTIAHNLAVVDTSVEISGLRVAMIVTKAPSEPWSVVQATLKAMIAQDIDGYPYDVWLADEDPSSETKEWCLDQGVRISSRKDVEEYNNVDWPRRRKCKEGNLMYFYDKWGYDRYDVVFQFDSDHAPTPSYLKNSLPAFMDPAVNYVAMPNINKTGSWISNARQTQEAWYYGPSQMSYSHNYMPMMTGSHYAVRTSALKEIGGIGPELDEDMNTTIMMNSRGKKGVYAGNAIAYGEGPLCLEDAQKQELQWAKSAVISFFRWRHVLIPKDSRMPAGGIIRFFMVRTWYTIQLAFSLYMWVFIAPLVFMNKWCSATDKCTLSFTNLVIHATPLLFANWGYEIMARKADWLRPVRTPFFSFDLVAYRILRPLWNTIGVMAGIFEMIFNVVPSFSVTRKGDSNTSPLGVLSMWYVLFIPAYYGCFIAIKLSLGDDLPITLVFLYAMIVVVYIYIVFRHFADQKFKALSIMNYVGHIAIICVLVGSISALCIVFRENIFTASSLNVFIPHFAYSYDMWLTIAINGLSIIWMLILFLV